MTGGNETSAGTVERRWTGQGAAQPGIKETAGVRLAERTSERAESLQKFLVVHSRLAAQSSNP